MTYQISKLHITPNDSLFFKEARPMTAKGNAIIESDSLPPIPTLMGALKTMIAQQYRLDFQQLKHAFNHAQDYVVNGINFAKLYAHVNPDDNPDLSIESLYFIDEKGLCYYPAPAHIGFHEPSQHYARLLPSSETCQTDIGEYHLCALPKDFHGYKTLKNAYFNETDFNAIVQGKLPSKKSHITTTDLVQREFHLGIQLNGGKVAEEGMLYQNQHIRLNPGYAWQAHFKHPQELQFESAYVRLGGEGRMAYIDKQATLEPSQPATHSATHSIDFANPQIALIINQDLAVPDDDHWLKLSKQSAQQQPFTVISAALAKPKRVGGWDLVKQQPKPVVNYLAAGSVYFLQVNDSALSQLQQGSNPFFPAIRSLRQLSLFNWEYQCNS